MRTNDALKHASETTRKLNPELFGNNSGETSDLEPGACDEPEGPDEAQAVDPPDCFTGLVTVTVTEYRRRLRDPDGGCSKWVIDAIIDAGVLPDDSAKHIAEVRHRQEKVKSEEQEQTVITIEEQGKE